MTHIYITYGMGLNSTNSSGTAATSLQVILQRYADESFTRWRCGLPPTLTPPNPSVMGGAAYLSYSVWLPVACVSGAGPPGGRGWGAYLSSCREWVPVECMSGAWGLCAGLLFCWVFCRLASGLILQKIWKLVGLCLTYNWCRLAAVCAGCRYS